MNRVYNKNFHDRERKRMRERETMEWKERRIVISGAGVTKGFGREREREKSCRRASPYIIKPTTTPSFPNTHTHTSIPSTS